MSTLLCDLARHFETDKGGNHYRYGGGDSSTCHNYTPHYHSMLNDRRFSVKHVLEIGVNAGSSLRMWRSYFPNADIVGIDSNAAALFNEERIRCFAADQNNRGQLHTVMSALYDKPLFDLIVDDGSHERPHQLVSLDALLPFLAPEGLYVVEDLGNNILPPYELYRPVLDMPKRLGYTSKFIKVFGGLGEYTQPHEWLFVATRSNNREG